MTALDLLMWMEMMPFAIVTVPSPLSTSVTFGPVPVPPPGMLAKAKGPPANQAISQIILSRAFRNYFATTTIYVLSSILALRTIVRHPQLWRCLDDGYFSQLAIRPSCGHDFSKTSG